MHIMGIRKHKFANMTSSDTQKCNNNMNLNVYLYFKLLHSLTLNDFNNYSKIIICFFTKFSSKMTLKLM